MKYKEPIKGEGMITLFGKWGYETYLVDEFRTSCKCCNCNGGDCEKRRERILNLGKLINVVVDCGTEIQMVQKIFIK